MLRIGRGRFGHGSVEKKINEEDLVQIVCQGQDRLRVSVIRLEIELAGGIGPVRSQKYGQKVDLNFTKRRFFFHFDRNWPCA